MSPAADRARTRTRLHEIGFVFQRLHLLIGLTALGNVAIPMAAAGINASDRHARAAILLDRVGLGDRLLAMPAQLSGSQRQRVAIARALANGARLILADEPTGALHSEDKSGVIALLQDLHSVGRTVVVVTHDAGVASICTRRLEIRDGTVTEVLMAISELGPSVSSSLPGMARQ